MNATILQGDCRDVLLTLDSESVQCVVTSPPYYQLKDYQMANQLGAESTLDEYLDQMDAIFRQVYRVLRKDGTLWLNLGDSYADKDLRGMPWQVALSLKSNGWNLRQDIIWSKASPMPESVTDRCTRSHEYVFLLAKSQHYYFDAAAIAEPAVKGAAGSTFTGGKTGVNGLGRVSRAERSDGEMRNKRSVWHLGPEAYPDAHFAVMPTKLAELCILAGSKPGDTVLDPFAGSGTTLRVARKHRRNAIGIELNPAYCVLIKRRLENVPVTLPMEDVSRAT